MKTVLLGQAPSEVIREALRLLEKRDEMRRMRLGTLRKEIGVGLDQLERGEVSEYDDRSLNTTPLERYPGKPRSWGRRRRFSLLDTSGLSPSTAKHRGACFASKPQAPPRWRPENLAV